MQTAAMIGAQGLSVMLACMLMNYISMDAVLIVGIAAGLLHFWAMAYYINRRMKALSTSEFLKLGDEGLDRKPDMSNHAVNLSCL